MSDARMALSAEAAELLTLDTDPWLSCDDCFEQVDGVVDGFVAGMRAIPTDFRAHLIGCPACYEEAVLLVELVAEEDGMDAEQVRTAFANALRS